MIVIADANVLIDLGLVNGLEVLTQLAKKVEVLDVVFNECTAPSQLQDLIISAGIQIGLWKKLKQKMDKRAIQ